jgi:hypothetical protein
VFFLVRLDPLFDHQLYLAICGAAVFLGDVADFVKIRLINPQCVARQI